jgi:dTDP-4-dehydrorhamnose 3,5-epimerase
VCIEETKIKGAFLMTRDVLSDERGYFCRLTDAGEFKSAGIEVDFVQISLSYNEKRGTLRGLHTQTGESSEEKFVVCSRGEIFDVCVDVRENSPTFGEYISAILSEANGVSLYIPKGCAHGYLTLTDNAQLIYFMSQFYSPHSERGYHYDDPVFGIDWPFTPSVISEKDRNWHLL